ncbi:alpha-amylase family glycosyl hydrolase [Mycoplasmatota bacterium WC30]
MNKKIALLVIMVIAFLALVACGNPQDAIAQAYPENDTYYEIFVRSFADSDDDGIGDFNGITAKLGYLADLGITGLWLMPIHPSPTYHGYDVSDYYGVNSDYGTMEDFENLVTEANEVGIKIMLDMVFNHSSSEHPWFQAALEGDETYMEYYNFIDNTVDTSNKLGSWNQSIWHSTSVGKYCGYFFYTMPDLNLQNQVVVDEILNISKFWIDKGVKGFRLDAAHHFFGENEFIGETTTYLDNIVFLKGYTKSIDEYAENIYITAEIYENQLYQVIGDYFGAVDSPLDFPVAAQIRTAAQNYSNRRYVTVLEDMYDYYRRIDRDFISAPFIVNHDMNRFASQALGNDDSIRLSAEMLLVLPGNPIIYYGEELGMYGYKASGPDIWDETMRLPLSWGDEFTADWLVSSHQDLINVNNLNATIGSIDNQLLNEESLLNHYKTMLQLRNDNIALKYGNSFIKYEDSTSSLQGFYREFEFENQHQKLLILHNFGESELDMVDYLGTIIYVSDLTDLTDVTKIPARSTVIIEIDEAE